MDQKSIMMIEIDKKESYTINEIYRYLLSNPLLDQEIFEMIIEKIKDVNILIDGVSLLYKFIRFNNYYLSDKINVRSLLKRTDEENINRRKNGRNCILECYYVIRTKNISKNLIELIEDERVDLRRYSENEEINYTYNDSVHYSMMYILIKNKHYEYSRKYFEKLIKQEIEYNREFYDIIEEIIEDEKYGYIEERIKDRVNMMSIKRRESIINIPLYIREIIIHNYIDLEEEMCNIPPWIKKIVINKYIYDEEKYNRINEISKIYRIEIIYNKI